MSRIPSSIASTGLQPPSAPTPPATPPSAVEGQPALMFHWESVLRSRKVRIDVRAEDEERSIYVDLVDIDSSDARRRFLTALQSRLDDADPSVLEQYLLEVCQEVAERRREEDPSEVTGAPTYFPVLDPARPSRNGLYRDGQPAMQLTNAVIEITRNVAVDDELWSTSRFEGEIRLDGQTRPFAIESRDFGADEKLKAALFSAAGSSLQLHGRLTEIRTAISATSTFSETRVTTATGWNDDGSTYRFPGGWIDAQGFHADAPNDMDARRVDLSGWNFAQYLGLKEPFPDMADLKRHIRRDFARLHQPDVMRCLLAAVALAIVYRFGDVPGKPAVFLKGPTGAGKTFLAQLAASFFGSFGVGQGRCMSWMSTANAVQHEGYAFRDAIFVVDDFKPEVVSWREVVKVLQTYSDNAARSRLQRDATSKPTRPIRGLLLASGEDLPEGAASATARVIPVFVPEYAKNHALGAECVRQAVEYPRLTADFIHYLIREGRLAEVPCHFAAIRQVLLEDMPPGSNIDRITSNLALLGAAYRLFTDYLFDAQPEADDQMNTFLREDLMALRDRILLAAEDQSPAEVFVHELADLVACGEVAIDNAPSCGFPDAHSKPVVGRWLKAAGKSTESLVEISVSQARRAVNRSLLDQGRPGLQLGEKALVGHLVARGLLLDKHGEPISEEQSGQRTYQVRLEGERTNVVRMRAAILGYPPGLLAGRAPASRRVPYPQVPADQTFPTAVGN